MKYTLHCQLQNRLGALDRLLGALTHRGFLPEAFSAQLDAGRDQLRVTVSFRCMEARTVEKLVKVLQQQVYVLDVAPAATDNTPALSQISA